MKQLFSKLEVPINVRDKSNAKLWYLEKLGIDFNERDRAEVAGVTVVMFEFKDFSPATHVIYQFVTSDLRETLRVLTERGVDTEIHEYNWNLGFSDPDGNKIVFYEPRG